jgi:hypothetical protein
MLSSIVLLACVLGLATAATFERTEYYHGEQVWTCGAPTEANFQKIIDEFDVWRVGDEDLDIRVKPHQMKKLLGLTGNCTVVVEDVEKQVADHQAELAAVSNATGPLAWHDEYHRMVDIHGFYRDLAAQYPQRTSFTLNFGSSQGGRNIPLFSIIGPGTITRNVLIQCQIHAREWISGAVCQWLAEYWLTNWNTFSPNIAGTRVYMLPVINPDGYEWSWTNSRLWRKNRRPGSCVGVDLNRNYPVMWGRGGSSGDPCSDTYMGPSSGSEAETAVSVRALRDLGVAGAVDMHSYSQLILRPFGFARTNSIDESRHSTLGASMRQAILRGGYNTAFTSQKSIDLYVTTGTFEGQAYGSDGTSRPTSCLGQTIELRPSSASPGFQLPPSQIIPSGLELREAFNLWFQFFQQYNLANNCGR